MANIVALIMKSYSLEKGDTAEEGGQNVMS